MPTGKRASMREGPLAALFRKTAEEEERPTRAEGRPEGAAPPPPPQPEERSLREEAPGPPVARTQTAESLAAEPERHIPSPQERLRQAFSADIPESLMEHPRPAPPQGGGRDSIHEPDPYARSERAAESF